MKVHNALGFSDAKWGQVSIAQRLLVAPFWAGKLLWATKSNFPTRCCFSRLREREASSHSPLRIIYNLGHGARRGRGHFDALPQVIGAMAALSGRPRRTTIVSQYEALGCECTPHSCRNILELNNSPPQCCNFLIKKVLPENFKKSLKMKSFLSVCLCLPRSLNLSVCLFVCL